VKLQVSCKPSCVLSPLSLSLCLSVSLSLSLSLWSTSSGKGWASLYQVLFRVSSGPPTGEREVALRGVSPWGSGWDLFPRAAGQNG
jgi:uncharacterized membrane protein YbjE (DUF340 family)